MQKMSKLLEMYENGMMDIRFDRKNPDAGGNMHGMDIPKDQATLMARMMGWDTMYEHPYVILEKTRQYMDNLCKYVGNVDFWSGAEVVMQSERISGTDKARNHLAFVMEDGTKFVVTCKFPHSGGAYCLYSSREKTGIPIHKGATFSNIANFFGTYLGK